MKRLLFFILLSQFVFSAEKSVGTSIKKKQARKRLKVLTAQAKLTHKISSSSACDVNKALNKLRGEAFLLKDSFGSRSGKFNCRCWDLVSKIDHFIFCSYEYKSTRPFRENIDLC